MMLQSSLARASEQPIVGLRTVVIFDFDGVLFDSEWPFFLSLQEALSEQGICINEQDYIQKDLQSGASLIGSLKEAGMSFDESRVNASLHGAYEKRVQRSIRPMSGAVDCIRRLSVHYTLAIASSSRRRYIDTLLRRYKIDGMFSVIVAREDVKNVKPNPECFNLVLSRLGRGPESAIIVEDSARGLIAATSAGIPCVMVPNELTRGVCYSKALCTVSSLGKLVDEVLLWA